MMTQNQNSPQNKKVCKHKAGDVWKDGCCGDDAVARENRTETTTTRSSAEAARGEGVSSAKFSGVIAEAVLCAAR